MKVPCLALLLLLPTPLFAWGCQGHQIVADIAARHLRPAVARAVVRLLAANPVPRNPRCPASAANAPPASLHSAAALAMARVASWADQIRDPSTAPEHFIDIPVAAERHRIDYPRLCRAGCVGDAIVRYQLQLQTARDPARRAEALRYLVHFIADIFQPLHAADDADRGGGCVPTRLPGARHLTSLHRDWDSAILARMLAPGYSSSAFAAALDRRFARDPRLAPHSSNPRDWAWQSHQVAVHDIYRPLHLRPGCTRRPVRIRARELRLSERAIARQLDRAALTLAAVLNRLLA